MGFGVVVCGCCLLSMLRGGVRGVDSSNEQSTVVWLCNGNQEVVDKAGIIPSRFELWHITLVVCGGKEEIFLPPIGNFPFRQPRVCVNWYSCKPKLIPLYRYLIFSQVDDPMIGINIRSFKPVDLFVKLSLLGRRATSFLSFRRRTLLLVVVEFLEPYVSISPRLTLTVRYI